MHPMSLLMITTILFVPLTGCVGTDGEVTVDLSTEELQEIIDDNKDDFLNNTTVVVFQEYHNNTTVVNNYNNSTDIDQSGASSTSSTSSTTNIYNGSNGADIRMFTVQWNPSDNVSDPTQNQLVRPIYVNCYDNDDIGTCNEWDYGWDSIIGDNDANINSYDASTIYVHEYNDQIIEITATCTEFFQYYTWNEEDWRDYLANNYGYDSNEIYDAANVLENKFASGPWNYRSYDTVCSQGLTDPIILFNIQLEQGTALEFLDYPELIIDVNCEDGFGTGIGNGTYSTLVGGQSNCTVTGSTIIIWDADENYNWESNNESNNQPLSWDFEVLYRTPESFAVYFELHQVTVHQ